MSSDWSPVRLGDYLKVKHGLAFPGEDFSEDLSGRPIIVTIGNFNYEGGFRFESSRLKEFRGDVPSDFVLDPGDVLVVMTCQTQGGEILGVPGRIPDDGRTYLHNQRLGKIEITRPESLDLSFAYWLMLSPSTKQQLFATSTGSKILHTAPSRIEDVRVDLPPLTEQRAIAGVLGALDDKIEANRRLAKSGAELIRAEVDGVSKDQWFPAAVSSLASFVNGGAFTKDASGIGRPVLRIADLKSGVTASTIRNDIDVPDVNIARAGDVLMAWSGSLDVYRWAGPESIINQHIFKVIPNKLPSWFVFDRLERAMPEFQQIAADKATTMGHIKRHHLDDVETFVPSRSDLAELSERLEPIWDRTLAAEVESHSLSSLRDALLPELLSGRLRVRDAESFLEDEL